MLYGKFITDTLTAYKIYKTSIIKDFTVKTKGFETDHELTAKLIKKGIRINRNEVARCNCQVTQLNIATHTHTNGM